jgi:anti-anti-sigma factor
LTIFREVAINFRTKTIGLFDAVMPELEDDEMFNSGMLRDHVTRMISAGRCYVAIDISPLDYIYSDGINALVLLNKQAQAAGGALALIAPQPKVVGILQTAGISSAMSVLAGEAELMELSAEIQAAAAPAYDEQSEFESLRSEIGSVFGGDAAPAARPEPPPPAAYVPPPPPVYAPPPPPPPPAYAPPPVELQPMAPPPPPPPAPAFPPPDAFPSETMSFGVLGDSAFDTAAEPKFSDPPPKSASFDDDFGKDFDELDGGFDGKKKKKTKVPLDDFNDLDADFGGKKKKKFKEPVDDGLDSDDSGDADIFKAKKGAPVAAIVVVVALLALAGGGYYYLTYMRGATGGDAAGSVAPTPAVAAESGSADGSPGEAAGIPIATVEMETPKPLAYAPTKPDKPEKPEKPDKKPDTKQKTAPSTSYPAPSYSTPSYSTPSPAPAYSAPAYTPPPEPAPPPPPKVEQVVVTSNPSGATVEVDGKRVGVTPYTINRPPWGDISIAVSMSGYERAARTIEFEGGTRTESFNLSRAAVAAPPPQPAYTPPPPPPPPAPAPAPPPPRPAAPPPAASSASIFIATLPPKADVYVGGKLVGTSNEGELQVPVGTHQVKFVKDGVEKTETITFNPGKNPTRFVNLK